MKIIDAVQSDFVELANKLRRSDWLEVMAVYGDDVEGNVINFYEVPGIKWAIKSDDDVVLAILGLQPTDNEEVGIAWMLTTYEAQKHAVEFIKITETLKAAVFSIYKKVKNSVHKKNVSAIKWLEYVGAVFQEPENEESDFLPFEIYKEG